MFGLLESVLDLGTNVVKAVAAPVEVVANLANAAVKPIADGLSDLAKETKDLVD